jgi:hypothetical protein
MECTLGNNLNSMNFNTIEKKRKENLQTQVTITVAAPISERHGNAQAQPPNKLKHHPLARGLRAESGANSRWQPLAV